MKDFSHGVSYYTMTTCEIGFPMDDVCCWWCPMMGVELKSDRHYCRKTGEFLPAPKVNVGLHCPLEYKKEE